VANNPVGGAAIDLEDTNDKAAKEAEKERERKEKELDRAAAHVKESIASPFEKAQEELTKLIDLFNAHKLTPEEFDKAQQKIQTDLAEQEKKADKKDQTKEIAAPKLLQANSNEAFKLIGEIQNRAGTDKRAEEQLAETKKHTDYLKTIADQAQQQQTIGEAVFFA